MSNIRWFPIPCNDLVFNTSQLWYVRANNFVILASYLRIQRCILSYHNDIMRVLVDVSQKYCNDSKDITHVSNHSK